MFGTVGAVTGDDATGEAGSSEPRQVVSPFHRGTSEPFGLFRLHVVGTIGRRSTTNPFVAGWRHTSRLVV